MHVFLKIKVFHNINLILLKIYFWVLNKEEEFQKAFDLGATGIMTDYPTRLMLFLKNKTIQ
jgi:glycerophosphoryl diester phosphodiesterase